MKKKSNLRYLLILIILLTLFFSIKLALTKQEIRKKAGNTEVHLSLYPNSESFQRKETKTFDLIASFSNGSSTERLDYIYTDIIFPSAYLILAKEVSIQSSGMGRIINIDSPSMANNEGKINIELGALPAGSGPTTDRPLVIAQLVFESKTNTPEPQDMYMGKVQIVNNRSSVFPVGTQGTSFSVSGINIPTPTTICSDVGGPCGYGFAGTLLGTCCNNLICVETHIPDAGGVCQNLIVEPSPTPRIARCNEFCLHSYIQCATGLECQSQYKCASGERCIGNAICVNPKCPKNSDCLCGSESCPKKTVGDSNCDSVINGVDYSIWLNSQCRPGSNQICGDLRADFDNDHDVDDDDLEIWYNNRE